MSRILLEDMQQIVADTNIPWNSMQDSTVLITGATGTIGSAIVRALYAANQQLKLNIKILTFGRDTEKAKPLVSLYGAEFIFQDICEAVKVDGSVDYIFHCAAVTKSFEMVSNPVGVIETSIKGTFNILTLAKRKHVKSMIYLSSMEVYGLTDPDIPSVSEADLGYIDLKNPRSCYPESKRMCESLCNSYFSQYDVPVKIARLAQTFGAGCVKDDPRVFGQFSRSALARKNIVLHTEGRSRGNYCYISDAIRGILLLLLKGENGEAYNIANPEASVTVREMAEIVADKVCGGRISVNVDVPPDVASRGYAPDVTMRLNVDKIKKLSWQPVYGLAEMYERMIAEWRGR
ncbi:NAD-dependent epimerase/dehydratase family protein [Sporomusa termitida]|uniref:dTDP-glucose 4,6-dehydratase n=1 Tax=Sporomusa termitida TaxID=2377 RepID=A0A517DX74_9FIRM|nr:NAD(P)-dependent oxidoreductase [Sporomusa termitida]QDR81959.1 dTDP-glucose 4,6-dehydratase [Sporomusa termitida]